MGRGRKRKFNPNIPSHIDQDALPRGVYWENGRWYVQQDHPDGGRPRKRTIAYGDARLSELHAFVEVARGDKARGTLSYLCDQFELSSEFKELAAGTQGNYRGCASEACGYQLKDGTKLGELQVSRLNVPAIQRLIETIAVGRAAAGQRAALDPRPSKANHVLRYLRRMFGWAIRFGHCENNPAKGVRQVKEVGAYRMPEPEEFQAVLDFAKQRGRLKAHTRGSVPPYLHAVMQLAYNLRLRGVEVTDLTDAHADAVGIRATRRKGSRDNVTSWNDELRSTWSWLTEYRAAVTKAHGVPVPIKPGQRRLLVNQSGLPLSKSGLDSAWQRMIHMAITEKVITPEQRFSLHGLKHRGITDTEGNRADKQEAAGHATPQMTNRYDHAVPVVQPPKRRG
ncbi:MAG TPA: integrase [Stenotrophomonas sp.]|nr:integrase [Stenotrophomonas sp.]